MIPAAFEYVAPTSVEDVVKQLGANADTAVLAGGQALLTELKLRRITPALVVDISGVEGIGTIAASPDGTLRIGATVTIDALARAKAIKTMPGALGDALAAMADPQVRNRATVGGGIANRAPGADLPAVALACAATISVAGADGTRT